MPDYAGTVQTSGNQAAAAALQAALALSTIDLGQTSVAIGKNTQASDFTVATYSGYTQQVVTTVPPPIIDPVNGGISLILPSSLFASSGPSVANTIFNWYLRTAGGVLIAAGAFPNPISMSVLGDAIPLSVVLNFPP
jgi:hypothetical protein